jgi:hypothetical protein
MKTHLIKKIIPVLTLISLIIISCSKKDNTLQPVVTPPVTPQGTAKSIGSILDSGTVSKGLRFMVLDLNAEHFTLYSPDDEVKYVSAMARVVFYVNNDGLIPSGDYNFTSSNTGSPFTFSSGALMLTSGSDSNNSTTDTIVDGSITVNQSGSSYSFAMNVSLASGYTTSQIFGGPVHYADKN